MKIKVTLNTLILLLFIALRNDLWARTGRGVTLPPEIGRIVIFIFLAFVILFITGLVIAARKMAKETEKLFKNFALYHGLQFSKEDTFNLKQELEETPFFGGRYVGDGSIRNILSQSDRNSSLYLFNCEVSANKSKQHYTTCFLKLKKGFDIYLTLRKRLPGFLEKLTHSLIGKGLNEINMQYDPEFNKNFVVYSDKIDLASKLMNDRVSGFIMSHKKLVLNPPGILIYICNEKLIVAVQHIGFRYSFKNETELSDFLEFSKGFKEGLVKNF